MKERRPKPPPRPPRGVSARGAKGTGPADESKHPETKKHAEEVQAVMRGLDIVEAGTDREQNPAAFKNPDMLVVRSWMNRRPLEPTRDAAALVRFPRLWSTRRGRYCRFVAPGAGTYALLRARPSF